MNAVRKIATIDSDELTLKIPAEFMKMQVEIIILPFEEETAAVLDREQRLEKIYQNYSADLPKDYKFNRDEAHER
ncbi:MAG: hypothetical protein PHQ23_03525 [Candidatus Wallbacteria bacterium]|nr:hypothetical protein [Candidatus Wallbacteria bacterium]